MPRQGDPSRATSSSRMTPDIHPPTDVLARASPYSGLVSERPLRFRRLQAIDPRWVDVTLAGFAVVLDRDLDGHAGQLAVQADDAPRRRDLSATGIALLLRRSHPLTGLVLAGIPVAIFTLLDYDVAGASAALSVYAVGAYGKRVHSLLGLAYVLGIILVLWLVCPRIRLRASAPELGGASLAGVAFGRAWRPRRHVPRESVESVPPAARSRPQRKAHHAREATHAPSHRPGAPRRCGPRARRHRRAGRGRDEVIDSDPEEARRSLPAIRRQPASAAGDQAGARACSVTRMRRARLTSCTEPRRPRPPHLETWRMPVFR